MKSLDTASKSTSSAMSTGFAGITRLLAPLAAAFSAVAVAQKVWTAGMAAADLEEQAQQIGLNTDQLQAYRLVAAQSGVSVEQLDGLMMKLTRAMGSANEGSDEMIARFDRLGVKLLDGNGKLRKTADTLPEVARGLLAMGDGAERDALMMEILGKSGTRAVTMLEAFARGSAANVDEAKRLNAVIGIDTIRAWDAFDAQLKIAEAQSKKTWAELGAPIATAALEAYNALLKDVNANLDKMKLASKLGTGTAAAAGDMQMLKEQLEVQESLLKINPNNKMAQSSADALRKRLADANALVETQKAMDAAQALFGDVGSPPTKDSGSKGGGQPTGKAAAKAGAALDSRLRELQAEHAALEKAMAAFDVRGDESVDAVSRRIEAQAKLDKKIFDVLKDVPPNSPLAAQLTQEATAISELNQQLDQRKSMLKIDEGVQEFLQAQKLEQEMIWMSAEAAASLRFEHELLNKAKAAGIPITAQMSEEMRRAADAMAEAEARTKEMKEIQDFAKETTKAFFHDVNGGLREGKDLWAAFGDAAMNALARISDKLIEMAVNQLFDKAFGGKGGGGGGGSFFSSILGNVFGGGGGQMAGDPSAFAGMDFASIDFASMSGMGFAEGGRPPVGRASWVGERGPELFVPDGSGTIFNREQLSSMGGNTTVIVNQTIHVGEYVTSSQYAAGLQRVERSAREGAKAALIDDRRRGGIAKQVFK